MLNVAHEDDFINRRIMAELDAKYHKFTSNSPNLTAPMDLVRIAATTEKSGGMTPQIARSIARQALSMDLEPVQPAEGFDPNLPFGLSMVRAAKNEGNAVEPGQHGTGAASPNPESTPGETKREGVTALLSTEEMIETLIQMRDASKSVGVSN